MAPSFASIDSIFRFLFTIGFSFQPRAFPPSLELTLERVISSRFVKLIPFYPTGLPEDIDHGSIIYVSV